MISLAAPLLAAHRLAPSLSDPGRFSLGRVMSLAPLGMAAALAGGVIEFGYLSLLPAYATEAGASDSTALHLLAVLLIGGVTLQFFMGWLADRVDRVRLLATLGLLLSALCALLAVLVDVEGSRSCPSSSWAASRWPSTPWGSPSASKSPPTSSSWATLGSSWRTPQAGSSARSSAERRWTCGSRTGWLW
jgi:MFS family permease